MASWTEDWINVDQVDGENDISGIRDYMAVSIDPLNPKHVMFGSFEEGLIEVIDGEIVEIWNESNSTIQQGDFGGSPRTGVSGVDFDKFGKFGLQTFSAITRPAYAWQTARSLQWI